MSEVTLRRVGSSLVATVPAEAASRIRIEEGQRLDVQVENGRLVLVPQTADSDAVQAAHDRAIQQYRAVFQKLADA